MSRYDPRNEGNCVVWLDAMKYESFDTPSSNVGIWKNLALLGAGDAVASGSAKPTWSVTGLNNRPAVIFDADDIMSIPYSAILSASAISVFAVAQRDLDTGGNQPIVGRYSTSDNKRVWNLRVGTGDTVDAYGCTDGTGGGIAFVTTGTSTVAVPFVAEEHYNGTTLTGVMNGQFNTQAALASLFATDCALDVGGGFGSFLNGKISEILFFNTYLSLAARLRVRRYLSAKWAIQTGAV